MLAQDNTQLNPIIPNPDVIISPTIDGKLVAVG